MYSFGALYTDGEYSVDVLIIERVQTLIGREHKLKVVAVYFRVVECRNAWMVG